MKAYLIPIIAALTAAPAAAEDFYLPKTAGAKMNSAIHRVITQAMTTGTLVENQINVQTGMGGGSVECKQGVTEAPDTPPIGARAPRMGGAPAMGPVVIGSMNVCINR